VKSEQEWSNDLSLVSGQDSRTTTEIVRDLRLDFKKSIDLHVQPLVPLLPGSSTLAVAPPFPLHSAPEENILRVCSSLRPKAYDAASAAKEKELRALLEPLTARFVSSWAVSLPDRNPDIDLILEDAASNAVAFIELKWIRKPWRPAEQIARDEDVLKGVRQLNRIRSFLNAQPNYLRNRDVLKNGLTQYGSINYLLVARDHWKWVDPTADFCVLEFETFVQGLQQPIPLPALIDDLRKYEWLPVEGRDFIVRYDSATVNGVSVESETYYAMDTFK